MNAFFEHQFRKNEAERRLTRFLSYLYGVCMSITYEHECQVAIDAVYKACELAKRMQGTLEALDVVNKEDLSPVTITDFSCQALINMHLLSEFPDAEIMGEEDALFLRNPQNAIIKAKVVEQIQKLDPHIREEQILDAIDQGGSSGGPNKRFWVLDPIDGTRGFIRNEQYAVALALIDQGEVVIGVLGCPRLPIPGHTSGGIFSAIKGKGTFLQPLGTQEKKRVHVSIPSAHAELIYCETHPSPTSSHNHSEAHKIAHMLNATPKPFRLDSQCKYAVVAQGEASIYFRIPVSKTHREKIWDHAPGMIVVEEAGGRVTDLYGNSLDFSHGKTLSKNFGLLATNRAIHDKALEAISKTSLP